MLDNQEELERLKNDKKKIAILISIIVFVVILIVLFIITLLLDLNSTEDKQKYSTTTRRTVNIEYTEDVDNKDNSSEMKEEESTTNSSTTNTTTTSTTKRINGNTNSPTKVITSTKIITSTSIKVVDILPPSITHEVANDKSQYPDSLDEWEWGIVNLINSERRKNGLGELLVGRDLRQLAEEAADLWLGSGGEVVKEYLKGHSNYRKYTNYDDVSFTSLYNDTIAVTNVTTNASLRYVGVGVIQKNDTYYYVIVYE